MFFGSQQHDAQEFLNFLLDKLSENLNRAELEEEEQKPSPPPQDKPKEQPTGEQASRPAEIAEQRPNPAVSVSASAEVKVSEGVVDGGTGGMDQGIGNEEQQPPAS
jgi:hypothetical protein